MGGFLGWVFLGFGVGGFWVWIVWVDGIVISVCFPVDIGVLGLGCWCFFWWVLV